MTDRDGREIPAGDDAGVALVQNLDNQDLAYYPVFSGEPVRLPAGRYVVLGSAQTPVAGQGIPSTTTMAAPEVTVDRDTVVPLDARKGRKVSVRVDRKDAAVVAGTSTMRVQTGTVSTGYQVGMGEDLYTVPAAAGDDFLYYNRAQVEQPLVRLAVTAPEAFEVPVAWAPRSPDLNGAKAFTAVDVGHATPAELAAHDLTGALAVFTLGAGEEGEYDARVAAIAAAGAAAALLRFSENISIGVGEASAIPVAYTLRPEGNRLAALGRASVTLTGIPVSPYRYELVFPHFGGIPSTVDYRPHDRELATVRADYHAMVPGGVGYLDFGTEVNGFGVDSGLWSTVVPLPVERTEYYTPGPVTWQLSVRAAPDRNGGVEYGYQGPKVTYRPGSRQSAEWGAAVVGPALAVDQVRSTGKPYLVAREGDTIRAALPLLSDAGRHSGYPRPEDYSFADTGCTRAASSSAAVGRRERVSSPCPPARRTTGSSRRRAGTIRCGHCPHRSARNGRSGRRTRPGRRRCRCWPSGSPRPSTRSTTRRPDGRSPFR